MADFASNNALFDSYETSRVTHQADTVLVAKAASSLMLVSKLPTDSDNASLFIISRVLQLLQIPAI